ncbi:MAG TPA: hypothetical protein VGB00_12780 [Pyrinomonadaceae bacterium]|jgi:hypothetical protein
MANLNSFHVHIQTNNLPNSRTDGDVYVGICGREFHCNATTVGNDFENNLNTIYTFGTGSNVEKAANNDPRNPQLSVEDVDRFPVYIRFEQDLTDSDGGEWNLRSALLHLNQNNVDGYDRQLGPAGIWLGRTSGAYLYLKKRTSVVNP